MIEIFLGMKEKEALEHIQTFSKDSLLVKSADVIANVSELLADIFKDGDVVFERFSVSKEKHLII